jgi:gas vesicle protein
MFTRKLSLGGISPGVIAGIAIGSVLLIGAITSYVGAANQGNQLEVAIKAKYADNENVYANGTQKVIEIAQVPEMYRDDLSKVTRDAIGGRYGEGGSKAVFQMLREQNPTLDASMYTRIQQVIEAFRNEFKNSQTALLDQCRNYETLRGNVWSGFWMARAGYPKRDIDKMCTIVSTVKAAQTFETKRDTGIQLRKAQ